MAPQPTIGIVFLAVATTHSVTNAFVPLENHARRACPVPTFDPRRSLVSKRGYSGSDIDDGNNKDPFLTPEPIDQGSSSSSDEIEILFTDESLLLNEISSPPVGVNPQSPLSDQDPNANAQAIFAENAAILSSGGDDTIDLGFDINVVSDTNPCTDATEDVPINEDLKAVLVASGEAAAAAEASMPQELVNVLDELAVEALNATTSNTNNEEKVDVSPPEVVPTIATISPPIIPAEQQDQQLLETSTIPMVKEISMVPEDQGVVDLSESSSKDDEETKEAAISTPSVGKILKFAVPAIGVWLCGPILSLIDTAAVGVFSGTVQQAALNPAVAVTDYAALLIVSTIAGV